MLTVSSPHRLQHIMICSCEQYDDHHHHHGVFKVMFEFVFFVVVLFAAYLYYSYNKYFYYYVLYCYVCNRSSPIYISLFLTSSYDYLFLPTYFSLCTISYSTVKRLSTKHVIRDMRVRYGYCYRIRRTLTSRQRY